MSERQDAATRPQQPNQEPYGHGPSLLGIHAKDLLYDLCVLPTWSEERRWRWVQGDKHAFHNWFTVEEHVPAALAEPGLSVDQVDTITGVLGDVNVALPYDEAERYWLFAAYSEAYGPDSISTIRQREPEEIVSRGLRRVIDGRDLMRRWWAWRRETDEFRGQGTLDIAREALRKLIETVAPGQLPEPYVALRCAQDASKLPAR
jgi:hypothetical protein